MLKMKVAIVMPFVDEAKEQLEQARSGGRRARRSIRSSPSCSNVPKKRSSRSMKASV